MIIYSIKQRIDLEQSSDQDPRDLCKPNEPYGDKYRKIEICSIWKTMPTKAYPGVNEDHQV